MSSLCLQTNSLKPKIHIKLLFDKFPKRRNDTTWLPTWKSTIEARKSHNVPSKKIKVVRDTIKIKEDNFTNYFIGRLANFVARIPEFNNESFQSTTGRCNRLTILYLQAELDIWIKSQRTYHVNHKELIMWIIISLWLTRKC